MKETLELQVQVRGEVVSSNLVEFRESLDLALAEINLLPGTDEEFGQAEADVKSLASVESGIKDAQDRAIKEASELHAVLSLLGDTSERVRKMRLELSAQVKKRKAEIKEDIIAEAVEEFTRRGEVAAFRGKSIRRRLEDAVKGKRTLDAMRSAAGEVVTVALGRLRRCREAIDEFVKAADGNEALVADAADLEMGDPDRLPAELEARAERAKLLKREREANERAEKLRHEAQDAMRAAAEAGKPPLPPLPGMQAKFPTVGQMADAAGCEWEQFVDDVTAAFARVRAARERLIHPDNIARAEAFSRGVNQSWRHAKAWGHAKGDNNE